MKSFLSALIIVFLLGCDTPTQDRSTYYPVTTELKAQYERPHALRKLFSKNISVTTKVPGHGSLSGGFFLIMGSVHGQYTEGTTEQTVVRQVRFAWKVDSIRGFAFLDVPLEKIRININSTKISVPTVAFMIDEGALQVEFWECMSRLGPLRDAGEAQRAEGLIKRSPTLRLLYNWDDAPQLLAQQKGALKYAVITCNEKDWPEDITVPSGVY